MPVDASIAVVVDDPDKDVPPEIFDLLTVEQVPIYPKCESSKNNIERRACMSYKLSSLIKTNFDKTIAGEHRIAGIQKIYVQLKI